MFISTTNPNFSGQSWPSFAAVRISSLEYSTTIPFTSYLKREGAFAEFERALMKERQKEGIALARQGGTYRGRKKALSGQDVKVLQERVASVLGDS